MKKILLISAERLGDTLFLTPALQFLCTQAPDVIVDVIAVTPLAAAVFQHNPNVQNLLLQPTGQQIEIMANDYDVVLIPHISPEARVYAAQFNARIIENPYFYQAVPAAEKAIKFFAEVLSKPWDNQPIAYQLFPQIEDEQYIKRLLNEKNVDVDKDVIVAMHVGCHGLAKKHSLWFKRNKHQKVWPLKKFVTLSRKLLKNYPNIKVVVTGSKSEEGLAESFLKKVPQAISLVNQTNVPQLATLFKYTKLFICSDTGALHVACAMQASLVGLYGPTDVLQTGPYPPSDRFVVLQELSLDSLPVNKVLKATESVVSKK